jgi:hypothetical protein
MITCHKQMLTSWFSISCSIPSSSSEIVRNFNSASAWGSHSRTTCTASWNSSAWWAEQQTDLHGYITSISHYLNVAHSEFNYSLPNQLHCLNRNSNTKLVYHWRDSILLCSNGTTTWLVKTRKFKRSSNRIIGHYTGHRARDLFHNEPVNAN